MLEGDSALPSALGSSRRGQRHTHVHLGRQGLSPGVQQAEPCCLAPAGVKLADWTRWACAGPVRRLATTQRCVPR